jgi:hypothetical protein
MPKSLLSRRSEGIASPTWSWSISSSTALPGQDLFPHPVAMEAQDSA